jgi:hypothetical protein
MGFGDEEKFERGEWLGKWVYFQYFDQPLP